MQNFWQSIPLLIRFILVLAKENPIFSLLLTSREQVKCIIFGIKQKTNRSWNTNYHHFDTMLFLPFLVRISDDDANHVSPIRDTQQQSTFCSLSFQYHVSCLHRSSLIFIFVFYVPQFHGINREKKNEKSFRYIGNTFIAQYFSFFSNAQFFISLFLIFLLSFRWWRHNELVLSPSISSFGKSEFICFFSNWNRLACWIVMLKEKEEEKTKWKWQSYRQMKSPTRFMFFAIFFCSFFLRLFAIFAHLPLANQANIRLYLFDDKICHLLSHFFHFHFILSAYFRWNNCTKAIHIW